MPSPLSTLRAAAGRAGGLRRSKAQRAALDALHRARRGVRLHSPGVTDRELSTLLGEISTALRSSPERGRVSLRALAAHCSVSDRTVRRWLAGEDMPDSRAVRRLSAWLRSVGSVRSG